MKIYTIDYKKHFGNDGTVYRQTIKIDNELKEKYNNKIKRLKKSLQGKNILTSDELHIMYYINTLKKGINYTNIADLWQFGKFITDKGLYNKRMFFNRNTIIEVL